MGFHGTLKRFDFVHGLFVVQLLHESSYTVFCPHVGVLRQLPCLPVRFSVDEGLLTQGNLWQTGDAVEFLEEITKKHALRILRTLYCRVFFRVVVFFKTCGCSNSRASALMATARSRVRGSPKELNRGAHEPRPPRTVDLLVRGAVDDVDGAVTQSGTTLSGSVENK